jgi:hypothetical protein
MTNYYIKGASDKWVRPAGWLPIPDIFSDFNLFKWSEEVQQSVWVKTFVTVTENLIHDPNGNLTADVIYEDSSTNNHLLSRTMAMTVGETYYVSFWIKSQGRDNVRLTTSSLFSQDGSTPTAWFDLSTGTIVSQNSGFIGSDLSLTSVGGGWYFVSYKQPVQSTATISVLQLNLSPNGSILSYAGDVTKGISVWGSQISKTSTLKPYQKNEEIAGGDNKLAFLFAVYENEENCFSLNYSSNVCNYDVEWGDGTILNVVNSNTIREKRYDYSAISSIVLQDELGIDYKQVIVKVTLNSGNITSWLIGSVSGTIGAPGNRPGRPQILEAIISHDHNVSFSQRTAWPLIQNLIFKKYKPTGSTSSLFAGFVNLRNIEGFDLIDISAVTAASSTFIAIGPINKIDIVWAGGSSGTTTMFSGSSVKRLGNVTLYGTGSVNTAFSGCRNLVEVGDVNLDNNTQAQSAFLNCYSLVKIGTITMNSMTLTSSMFSGCYSLQELEFTDCANLTTIASMFLTCLSLRKLVMPNLVVSLNVANCNLQRPEIIDLLDNLGSPLTTQNVTLTANPGMIDLTNAEIMAILTPKNWTYTA